MNRGKNEQIGVKSWQSTFLYLNSRPCLLTIQQQLVILITSTINYIFCQISSSFDLSSCLLPFRCFFIFLIALIPHNRHCLQLLDAYFIGLYLYSHFSISLQIIKKLVLLLVKLLYLHLYFYLCLHQLSYWHALFFPISETLTLEKIMLLITPLTTLILW